jgi:hypothetical protein
LNDGSVLSTARQNRALAFDISRLSDLFKVIDQSNVRDHGPVHDMQTDTIAGHRNSIFIRDTGSLAAQCRITGNSYVRVNSEGCWLCSTQANFFLNGPDGINVTVV